MLKSPSSCIWLICKKNFFKQNTPELNPTAPFLDLESEDSIKIFKNAMKRSERWRKMKGTGKSEEEMFEVFQKEVPMSIFFLER